LTSFYLLPDTLTLTKIKNCSGNQQEGYRKVGSAELKSYPYILLTAGGEQMVGQLLTSTACFSISIQEFDARCVFLWKLTGNCVRDTFVKKKKHEKLV
jgi:hypothetical protein